MPHCDIKPFFYINRDESEEVVEIEYDVSDWSSPPASPTPEETPQTLDYKEEQENESEDLDETEEYPRESDDHVRVQVNVTPPEESDSLHTT